MSCDHISKCGLDFSPGFGTGNVWIYVWIHPERDDHKNGVITAIIGLSVFASSLYGLLTMSVLIPIILNRIRMEERMLTEEFGDAHRRYKETTSKLIPFIY